MPVADKIAALMESLRQEDVEAMAPARRERFAFLCSRWANVARVRPEPKSGVLASLKSGERAS
jgi:diphthamide synthase subunit DPH2